MIGSRRTIAGIVAGIAAAALVASAVPCAFAQAGGGHPHERNGFFIGVGAGAGSGAVSNGSNRESGANGLLRVGGALRDDLVLGFEGAAWTHTENQFGLDVTVTFSLALFAATYYPGDMGLYVKGGVGFARVSAEAVAGNLAVTTTADGWGMMGAAGYEWRLTRKFALGPEVQLAYLDVGEGVDTADWFAALLAANWYW